MNAPKEVLGQVLGRDGRPAIVDMTVEQVRDLDPGFCERLEHVRPSDGGSCEQYLDRTLGELAHDEHISVGRLLAAAEAAVEAGAPPATDSRPDPGPRQERSSGEPAAAARFEAAAHRDALAHRSPDEQAMFTEGELRPTFDTEVRGTCFAPLEGYTIVESGPTSFRHHGFYVVDEPCKGMKTPQRQADPPHTAATPAGARIPGEVARGELAEDLASTSLMPRTPAELGLKSSVDAAYRDLRHLARGGPHMAGQ